MSDRVEVFGYGSLMNTASLLQTIAEPIAIEPARLFGYMRIYNVPHYGRFDPNLKQYPACLNIRKENNGWLNGSLITILHTDFVRLKNREKGYQVIQVEVQTYTGEYKQALTFQFIARKHPFLMNSSTQNDYVKICLEGCKEFGNDFYSEFIRTTRIYK